MVKKGSMIMNFLEQMASVAVEESALEVALEATINSIDEDGENVITEGLSKVYPEFIKEARKVCDVVVDFAKNSENPQKAKKLVEKGFKKNRKSYSVGARHLTVPAEGILSKIKACGYKKSVNDEKLGNIITNYYLKEIEDGYCNLILSVSDKNYKKDQQVALVVRFISKDKVTPEQLKLFK